jgi:hypothetical protein
MVQHYTGQHFSAGQYVCDGFLFGLQLNPE